MIGAGVAGSSVAERLAARGWQVVVVDEADGPGQGASGNKAGVFRPLPSLDDNRLARITRAGFLYGRHHLARLAEAGHPVRWAPTGVLHLARDDKQAAKMQAVVDTHQYPTDYLRFADRDEASRLANWPVAQGGWWFPQGGWIQPPTLCAANLAAGGDRITSAKCRSPLSSTTPSAFVSRIISNSRFRSRGKLPHASEPCSSGIA